jgi:hypothetical protein
VLCHAVRIDVAARYKPLRCALIPVGRGLAICREASGQASRKHQQNHDGCHLAVILRVCVCWQHKHICWHVLKMSNYAKSARSSCVEKLLIEQRSASEGK